MATAKEESDEQISNAKKKEQFMDSIVESSLLTN